MAATAEREMRQNIVDHISRFNSAQLRRILDVIDEIEFVPNDETIAAMEEARMLVRDPDTKRYSSFGEIVAEIDAEIAAEDAI